METRTEFVYYAMSNASKDLYPNNKPQDFKIHLPQALKLEGEWEVGISSAIYPYTWASTHTSKIKFGYHIETSGGKPDITKWNSNQYTPTLTELPLEIGDKFFNSLEDLVKEINFQVNTAFHNLAQMPDTTAVSTNSYIELKLSTEQPNRIRVQKGGYDCISIIELPETTTSNRDLWRKLGFEDSVKQLVKFGASTSYESFLLANNSQVIAKYPASIINHLPALYVYSPMIQYVGVGDTLAPLIGLLPVKGKPGDIIYERFDKPIYNPISLNLISDIEIGIKDDQGQDVRFLIGKTIFTLHFRRRS